MGLACVPPLYRLRNKFGLHLSRQRPPFCESQTQFRKANPPPGPLHGARRHSRGGNDLVVNGVEPVDNDMVHVHLQLTNVAWIWLVLIKWSAKSSRCEVKIGSSRGKETAIDGQLCPCHE